MLYRTMWIKNILSEILWWEWKYNISEILCYNYNIWRYFFNICFISILDPWWSLAQHAWPWTMYISQVQILAGLPTFLKGVSMLYILLSIAYSEFIWYLIKSNIRPYKDMDRVLKFIVGINYVLAIALGSKASFMFAVVCSLYQLVIFKFRMAEED